MMTLLLCAENLEKRLDDSCRAPNTPANDMILATARRFAKNVQYLWPVLWSALPGILAMTDIEPQLFVANIMALTMTTHDLRTLCL